MPISYCNLWIALSRLVWSEPGAWACREEEVLHSFRFPSHPWCVLPLFSQRCLNDYPCSASSVPLPGFGCLTSWQPALRIVISKAFWSARWDSAVVWDWCPFQPINRLFGVWSEWPWIWTPFIRHLGTPMSWTVVNKKVKNM